MPLRTQQTLYASAATAASSFGDRPLSTLAIMLLALIMPRAAIVGATDNSHHRPRTAAAGRALEPARPASASVYCRRWRGGRRARRPRPAPLRNLPRSGQFRQRFLLLRICLLPPSLHRLRVRKEDEGEEVIDVLSFMCLTTRRLAFLLSMGCFSTVATPMQQRILLTLD